MASLYPVFTEGSSPEYYSLISEIQNELGRPWQALCDAVDKGDVDRIRQEAAGLDSSSILHAKRDTVLQDKPDVLQLLLGYDSHVSEDLVVLACEQKKRECCRVLLQAEWPINRPVLSAGSVLCTAVDDLSFMQWLVGNGADVNAKSELNESALSIAIARGSMDVVHFLLPITAVEHGDLLHCAAERQNQIEGAELVHELVQRGAEVNAHRHNNPVAFRWRGLFKMPTPLHIACREKNIPAVHALLQNNADPRRKMLEAGGPAAPTPLEIALESGCEDLLKAMQMYIPKM